LAFTRNPVEGFPATYEGTNEIDTLILADQPSDITINGLDAADVINVSAAALAANALSNYKIYGNDGGDTISVNAGQLATSTVQGGAGDDAITFTANANALGSVIRGGADDDTISVSDLNSTTVNGNLGTDTITVTGNAFSSRVYGGSENDTINIDGVTSRDTRFNGSKGADFLNVRTDSNLTSSSVFGGEGADQIVTVTTGGTGLTSTFYFSGDKGDDLIRINFVSNDGTVNGGEGIDTITVGNAADTSDRTDIVSIDASTGADTVTVAGASTKDITFDRGDSVAATAVQQGTSLAAITPTAAIVVDNLTEGNVVRFGNGVDVITGFTTGTDLVDVDITVPAAVTNGVAAAGTTYAANAIVEIRGTWAGNGFSVAAAGADYLYVIGGSNLTASAMLTNTSNAFVSTGAQLAITDFA